MGDPDHAPRRFDRSTVTLGLGLRVLLTLPVPIAPWLVIRFWRNLATAAADPGGFAYPGAPISDVVLAFLGVAVCFALPRYLRGVWAENPDWRRTDRAALALQLHAQESLDKEAVPQAPIETRRAPQRW
jgi:hypothetical protein